MRAIIARELGPPETLEIGEAPDRPLAAGELRIGVHYAGVSFVDVLTAAGGYQVKPPTPFIPGSECSGVVLEAGPGASGFAPGDRVSAGGFGGIFAESIIVPATIAAKVPDGVAMVEAAVIPSSYLTAVYALTRRAQVQADETVLVLGAAGAVGVAAIQVAKAAGARVIASASSAEKRQIALASGADEALDSTRADWRDQIKALTGGRGVDVVVDPLGGEATERAFRSLAWKGRHLVIGFVGGGIPRLPTNLALLKGAALMGVDLRQFGIHEPAAFAEVTAEVWRLAAAGVARPAIAKVFAFDDYVPAMQFAASGAAAGRVLLRMPAADAD